MEGSSEEISRIEVQMEGSSEEISRIEVQKYLFFCKSKILTKIPKIQNGHIYNFHASKIQNLKKSKKSSLLSPPRGAYGRSEGFPRTGYLIPGRDTPRA